MITLVQPTDNFLPAFNRINFQISSDIGNSIGFKFAIKIYNADTLSLVTTAYYDTLPNPFAPVTFDISRFISDGYQFEDLFPSTGKFKYNECILNRFYLKCYEYYDVLGNGIYEIDPASEVVSGTYTCFAGSFNFFDRPEWNPNTFDGSGLMWYPLTDQLNFSLHKDFFKVFTFYNPNDDISDIEIVRNDIGTQVIYNEIPPTNTSGDDLTHFNFRPSDYGVNDNTISFTLKINYGAISLEFSNITMLKCSKYEVKNIVWLNRFGGLDSYSFNLANRKQTKIERKNYQRDYLDYGRSFTNPYYIFQSTSPTFFTKESQTITINTNYISDQESIVFRQLYSSPLIYLFASGDYAYTNNNPEFSFINASQFAFIPVKLIGDSYEIRQKENEKLFQIETQLEYSEPSYRQIT
jgi:hypothetical protein